MPVQHCNLADHTLEAVADCTQVVEQVHYIRYYNHPEYSLDLVDYNQMLVAVDYNCNQCYQLK